MIFNRIPDTVLHPVVMAVTPAERTLRGREKVASLRRSARRALDMSARCNGITLKDLQKDDLGAPVPQNGIYWSLSHKDSFVAAVAAAHPIGIDIEMVKPVSEGLYHRIADEREWALTCGERRISFFRIWTAKEAVLKAIGKGMTALDDCRVVAFCDDLHVCLTAAGTPWKVAQHWVGHKHLAAVTTQGEKISWHLDNPFSEKEF